MKNISLVFVIVSIVFGGVTYLALENIFFALGVFVISVLYFIFIAWPLIKKNKCNSERFHECYRFINNFIISLSIRGSLPAAFESVSNMMSDQYIILLESIKEESELEKLRYLSKYFSFHIYSIFISIIELWIEQGGDILEYSKTLINEVKNNETYLLNCERIFRRKCVEFISLWAFSLLIVIILRFCLTQFYKQISTQLVYQLSICMFFMIILVSFDVLLRRGLTNKMKGWNL